MTQEDLARATGADAATISRLVDDGHVDMSGASGDPLHQLYRHWSEQAAGRRGNGPLDLCQQRARLAQRQADRIELELRASRGDLLPRPLLVDYWHSAASIIRQKMLALPSRFKSVCNNLTPKDANVLDDLVREILTEISTARLPDKMRDAFREWEIEGKEYDESNGARKQSRRLGASSPKTTQAYRRARVKKSNRAIERSVPSTQAATSAQGNGVQERQEIKWPS